MSELLIGRIMAVAEHAGACAPADLRGAQILCRREADGLRVIGAHSHGKGLVLLRPDREVEDGTLVD